MIEIVTYDRAWPRQFAAEAARIRDTMPGLALRVEHVGSTSMPGVAAKPVIDIQVSVASLENLGVYIHPLAQLGYTHIPFGAVDAVYPFFRKPDAWPSTHHIHLCVQGSEHERRHLAFRDYLRAHPEIAAQYVETKRLLAAAHDGMSRESRERYSLAKSPFIDRVLEQAQAAGYPRVSEPAV